MRRPLQALPSLLLLLACGNPAGSGVAMATRAAGGLPFAVTEQGRFDEPFAMAFLPDARLLVTEKAGALKLRAVNGRIITVRGVPSVATGGQGGLLDVAIAPNFADSHQIYLSYAERRPGGSSLALARATLSETDGTARLDGLQVIWRQGSDGKGGQYGAVIAFSPDGKALYLTSGERQRFTPAQDPNQALGKIIRLTLDGQPAPGNPAEEKTGAATVKVFDPPRDTLAAFKTAGRVTPVAGTNRVPAETWSTGHRNPYGLAFAADGRLWETEMGPRGGDELNLIEPGRNYGWPNVSNGDNYDGVPIPDHRAGDGFAAPKLFWNPSISPGGFMIYSGSVFPAWRGSGFIAALSGESLIRVVLNGDAATKADEWPMQARLRDVAEAPDGSIWLLEDGSGARLLRLTPRK